MAKVKVDVLKETMGRGEYQRQELYRKEMTSSHWELVQKNTALIGYMFKRYFSNVYGYPKEELLDAMMDGLIHAAFTWVPERSKFGTWACKLIWQKGMSYLSSTRSMLSNRFTASVDRCLKSLEVAGYFIAFDDDTDDKMDRKNHLSIIHQLLEQLTPRARYIITERMKNRTLQDLANELKVTREAIRVSWNKGIKRMQKLLSKIKNED